MTDKKSSGKDMLPCLGTTTIICLRDEDSTQSGMEKEKSMEGILTVFHIPPRGEEEEEGLKVYVTDGKAVYHGTIEMEDVTMPALESLDDNKDSASQKAKTLANFLLGGGKGNVSDDKVKISYILQQNSHQRIKMSIKFHTTTKKGGGGKGGDNGNNNNDNVVVIEKTKRAWAGTLKRSSDLFGFLKILGKSINQGKQVLNNTQKQMDMVQHQRDSWKNTAQKLEGAWQNEKDTVIQNFVKLYNPTCEELNKTQKELAQAKQALLVADSETNKPTTKRGKKRSQQPREAVVVIPDQPDDHDHNMFDDELVEAMANGKKVSLAKRNNNIESKNGIIKKEKDSKATTASRVKEEPESSESDDDDYPKKKKAKTSTTVVKQELDYDSDDSTENMVRAMLMGGGR